MLGAGNLATHLALALYQSGENIVQVFSRTRENAAALAGKVGAEPLTRAAAVSPDADVCLYALADAALPEIINAVPANGAVHAHTAGSMPMALFAGRQENYGVFYPLQTFSKAKPVDFAEIPVFLESATPGAGECLDALARKVSRHVYPADSARRRRLHLAAVFACNFSNHLYHVADELLGDIPFAVMQPLLAETLAKTREMPPARGQTGPARRGDVNVMRAHLEALAEFPEWREIYRLLSRDIMRVAQLPQAEL